MHQNVLQQPTIRHHLHYQTPIQSYSPKPPPRMSSKYQMNPESPPCTLSSRGAFTTLASTSTVNHNWSCSQMSLTWHLAFSITSDYTEPPSTLAHIWYQGTSTRHYSMDDTTRHLMKKHPSRRSGWNRPRWETYFYFLRSTSRRWRGYISSQLYSTPSRSGPPCNCKFLSHDYDNFWKSCSNNCHDYFIPCVVEKQQGKDHIMNYDIISLIITSVKDWLQCWYQKMSCQKFLFKL